MDRSLIPFMRINDLFFCSNGSKVKRKTSFPFAFNRNFRNFAGNLNLNIYCRYDSDYFSGWFCSLV